MILGIYGESDSGKTTLVEKLIIALEERNYRVATVKYLHEKGFSMDTEGKDTWRYSKAGSEVVVAHSENEAAFIINKDMAPEDVAKTLSKIAGPDIIIAEGLNDEESPKIAMGNREERPNTIMMYSDNFDEVLSYAVEGIETEKVLEKLPGLDCGKCGIDTCQGLASAIRGKKNTFDDCQYFSEKRISLKVDGKEIPLGKFAKEILAGTIAGMVSSLKGAEGGRSIKIEIKN